MLTITPQALSVIRRVTGHPSTPTSAGVRIGTRTDPWGPLEVRAVNRPRPGDRVLERGGGRLYLGRGVVERVTGRQLDVVTDRDGRVQFVARDAA